MEESIGAVLEPIAEKEPSKEHLYIEKIYQTAISWMRSDIPQYTPKSSTVVLTVADDTYVPMYLGEYKDESYIYFPKEYVPSKEIIESEEFSQSEEFLDDCSAMVHELTHQWLMEKWGVITNQNVDLKDVFPNGMDGYSTAIIHTLVDEEIQIRAGRLNDTLDRIVIEGFVVWNELFVLQKQIEKAEESGLTMMAKSLQTIYQKHFTTLRTNSQQLQDNPSKRMEESAYPEGYFMMERLYKSYGPGEIDNTIQTVDLPACKEITVSSPMYKEIQDNPLQIPKINVQEVEPVAVAN